MSVAVTGVGCITSLGGNFEDTWSNLISGASGVVGLDTDWSDGMPVKVCAPVKEDPSLRLPRVFAKRVDRCQLFAMIAAREAWDDAGLEDDSVDPTRLGVVIGTAAGGLSRIVEQDEIMREQGYRRASPFAIPMFIPNGAAAWVSMEFGARGGVHAPTSACASGAEAIVWACRMLELGEVDVVIAGGTDAPITRAGVGGFIQAGAMSKRSKPEGTPRPFDTERDGFVLGEGSGVLILERDEFAQARGKVPFGFIHGWGITSDAFHITAPQPDGEGQERALRKAMLKSALGVDDVHHVNCHATGTPKGDTIEAAAVERVIGLHPLLTSVKGSLGHPQGAAGAIEAALTIKSCEQSRIPKTLNCDLVDEKIKLEVVKDKNAPVDHTSAAVTNSFGFGGHNVSLVVSAH